MSPLRLAYFSILAAVCCACSQPHAASDFVLHVALAGPMEPLTGDHQDGYVTMAEELVYETPLTVSSEGVPEPGIANKIEKLADKRVRITLRPGATFSDGSPVSLEDVAQSIAVGNLHGEPDLDGLIVSSTVPGVSPETLLPLVAVIKHQGGKFLGSGPFFVAEQDASHLLLKRRVPVPKHINTILMTSYDGPREALARLLRGEANAVFRLETRDLEFFEGIPRLRVLRDPDPHSVAIAMNSKRLSSEERQEIARAMPVKELNRTAFEDSCRDWPRGMEAQAPVPHRPLTVLTNTTDAELARLGLAVRRALGDSALVERPTILEMQQQVSRGDFDLLVMTPLVWPLGVMSLALHSGSKRNLLHYSNKAVDAAFEQGTWLQALDAMEKDPPYIFICTRGRNAVIDARIKDAHLGPFGMLQSLPDWEVGE